MKYSHEYPNKSPCLNGCLSNLILLLWYMIQMLIILGYISPHIQYICIYIYIHTIVLHVPISIPSNAVSYQMPMFNGCFSSLTQVLTMPQQRSGLQLVFRLPSEVSLDRLHQHLSTWHASFTAQTRCNQHCKKFKALENSLVQ